MTDEYISTDMARTFRDEGRRLRDEAAGEHKAGVDLSIPAGLIGGSAE